jgi:hypothetical protein
VNTMQRWHQIIKERNPAGLDEILAQDCVFLSPVVHTPQVGKELTTMYLTGAMMVFNESFRYVKEVVTEEHAVLEFVCEVDGIVINGVDIISFDAQGQIVEFKVMIRPLKAINMMQAKMFELLSSMSAEATKSA